MNFESALFELERFGPLSAGEEVTRAVGAALEVALFVTASDRPRSGWPRGTEKSWKMAARNDDEHIVELARTHR